MLALSLLLSLLQPITPQEVEKAMPLSGLGYARNVIRGRILAATLRDGMLIEDLEPFLGKWPERARGGNRLTYIGLGLTFWYEWEYYYIAGDDDNPRIRWIVRRVETVPCPGCFPLSEFPHPFSLIR